MSATRARLTPLGIVLAFCPGFASAQTASGVETKPPPSWRFGLDTGAVWYENPYFVGTTGSSSSWSGNAHASLSRSTRFKNGSFSLSAFGGAFYYPDIDSFSQPTYGGSAQFNTALSRRTRLSLGQTYSRSNTRYLRETDPEGLPLPTSGLSNAVTSVGLTQELARRWQLSLGASYTLRRYDNELLTGGEQLGANAQLNHSVGAETNVFLAYAYGASWYDDRPGAGPQRMHQALLGLQKRKDQFSFEVAGGTGYLEATESFYPAGRASVTASGRKTSFSVYYVRDFGQAFGYGRQMIGDLAGATFSWLPVRRVTLSARYNFGYRRDPADESYYIRSHIAGVGLDWSIGAGLSFGAGYSRERNETQGRRVAEGGRAQVSLSYGVGWR